MRIYDTRANSAHIVSSAFKVIILVFTAITVLRVLGLDVTLAERTFLIVVGGAVLALAIALGIGFGFAIREEALKFVKNARKKL